MARKRKVTAEKTQEAVPSKSSGRAYGVPNLPLHFVRRQDELKELKKVVLGDLNKPVAITGTGAIGLRGMGGIGKSVLAAWLAQDQEILAAVPDGVFWIVVGQNPAIESLQAQLAVQLGHPGGRLPEALADKACLVILDDVWESEHARAFDGRIGGLTGRFCHPSGAFGAGGGSGTHSLRCGLSSCAAPRRK